jgi:hypothetical protein
MDDFGNSDIFSKSAWVLPDAYATGRHGKIERSYPHKMKVQNIGMAVS